MAAVAPNWKLLLLKSVLKHAPGLLSLLCPWKMWNSTADPPLVTVDSPIKFLRQELCVLVQTKWIFPVCWPTASRVLSHLSRKIPLLPSVVSYCSSIKWSKGMPAFFFSNMLAFPSFFPISSIVYLFSHRFANGTLNFRTRRVVAQGQLKMQWLWISEIGYKSHLLPAEWI